MKDRRTAGRAGRAAVWMCLALGCPGPVNGQAPLSAQEIRSRLEGEAPAASQSTTRSLAARGNPDASTRVCDPALNKQLVQRSGLAGELLTRSMYVEQAPSVDLDIEFELGSAKLLPRGAAQLDALAQVLREPDMARQSYVLAGHTDMKGTREYNERLSCERALSARRYLVERHRLDAAKLVPMGFGFERLKDPRQPYDGVNRRVEVRKFQEPGRSR